jgi:hypothetical protein
VKTALLSFACLGAAVALAPACGSGFPTIGQGKKLVVTVVGGNVGTPQQPLAVQVAQATSFNVTIQAQLPDGTMDTSFNGFVNVSVAPGTVTDLSVRNVQLQNGQLPIVNDPSSPLNGTRELTVPVLDTFGEAHIWAEDLGFRLPSAPTASTTTTTASSTTRPTRVATRPSTTARTSALTKPA